MAIYCGKCGKEVDTLAKRRHRCRKGPPPKDTAFPVQLVWWAAKSQILFDHVGNGKTD